MAKAPSRAGLLLMLLGAACVVPSPERQLLQNFFAACQAYDTSAIARFAAIACNPRTEGVVDSFEILGRDGQVVTIAAQVRPLGGQPAAQTIRVTLTTQEGRLLVAGVTRLPASQTSPAASSVPPN